MGLTRSSAIKGSKTIALVAIVVIAIASGGLWAYGSTTSPGSLSNTLAIASSGRWNELTLQNDAPFVPVAGGARAGTGSINSVTCESNRIIWL